MSNIVKLKPENEKLWREYVLNHPDSSIFHTLEWKKVLEESFSRFESYYFLSIKKDNVKGVIPTFFTKSLLGGKKLISLPNNNSVDPLTEDQGIQENLIEKLLNLSKELEVDYFLLKTTTKISDDILKQFSLSEKVFYLEPILKNPRTDMMSEYSSQFRTNLRKLKNRAEEKDLLGKEVNAQNLIELYDNMSDFIKNRHKFIPQPLNFFTKILEHLNNQIRIFAIKKDTKVIGSGIILIFCEKAHLQWMFYDLNYKSYSPSHLLYDYICRTLGKENYKQISFGFTPKDDEGGLFAKTRYTSNVRDVRFYYREFKENSFPEEIPERKYQSVRTVFPYIPQPLFNLLVPAVHRLFR